MKVESNNAHAEIWKLCTSTMHYWAQHYTKLKTKKIMVLQLQTFLQSILKKVPSNPTAPIP